jgi:nitronate monooxygenase
MGTRFTATRESLWDLAMKAAAVAAGGDQTEQTRVFDVVRAALWPAIFYPGVFCGTRSRRGGTDGKRKQQEEAYLSTASDDFATRVVWAGEGVDLVKDVPTASEIIERIVDQAASTLTQAGRLVRGTQPRSA